MMNVSCFFWLNCEVHRLMFEEWERGYMMCVLIFFRFHKYGTNTILVQLKMGSKKTDEIISNFFRRYGNRRDKYRNTSGTSWDFFGLFSPLVAVYTTIHVRTAIHYPCCKSRNCCLKSLFSKLAQSNTSNFGSIQLFACYNVYIDQRAQ